MLGYGAPKCLYHYYDMVLYNTTIWYHAIPTRDGAAHVV